MNIFINIDSCFNTCPFLDYFTFEKIIDKIISKLVITEISLCYSYYTPVLHNYMINYKTTHPCIECVPTKASLNFCKNTNIIGIILFISSNYEMCSITQELLDFSKSEKIPLRIIEINNESKEIKKIENIYS